jgi:hypothetical protein
MNIVPCLIFLWGNEKSGKKYKKEEEENMIVVASYNEPKLNHYHVSQGELGGTLHGMSDDTLDEIQESTLGEKLDDTWDPRRTLVALFCTSYMWSPTVNQLT